MKTREELRVELETVGVTGAAQDAILAETAPARHEWRVEAAVEAAGGYYLESLGRLLADIAGVGGRDDCMGDATTRHPSFRDLGKGRKQATDGPAYSAAIREAAARIVRHYEAEWPIALSPGGSGVLLSHSVGMESETPVNVDAPPQWLRSLAREGLRRAAAYMAPISIREELSVVGWEGSLNDWADMVNSIEPACATLAAEASAASPAVW